MAVLAAACSPAGPSQSTVPEATSTPVKVEITLGPGDFDLPDTRVGLNELTSYAAALTLSFEGTQDGQPHMWSYTHEMRQVKAPAAWVWSVAGVSEPSADQPVMRAQAGGLEYAVLADGSCTAHTLDAESALVNTLEPAGYLTGLFGAESLGQEVVDGAETNHYGFDERALAQAGSTKSSGEVWVAATGGYIVRYLASSTAGEEFFGEGMQGTMKWDYKLSDVNQPLTIDLPAACPPGFVDAPMMPDAANVKSSPGVLQYESPSSLADVLAFYDKELPAVGWVNASTAAAPEGVNAQEYEEMLKQMQALGMAQPGPAADASDGLRVFEQGSRRLSVLVAHEGSTTTVTLSLGRKSE
jgi:hypothetical protein